MRVPLKLKFSKCLHYHPLFLILMLKSPFIAFIIRKRTFYHLVKPPYLSTQRSENHAWETEKKGKLPPDAFTFLSLKHILVGYPKTFRTCLQEEASERELSTRFTTKTLNARTRKQSLFINSSNAVTVTFMGQPIWNGMNEKRREGCLNGIANPGRMYMAYSTWDRSLFRNVRTSLSISYRSMSALSEL